MFPSLFSGDLSFSVAGGGGGGGGNAIFAVVFVC